MELRRNARAKGESYELTGDYIESDLTEGALERGAFPRQRAAGGVADACHRAPAAPVLRPRLAAAAGERPAPGTASDSTAVRGRSVALARGFRMEADSLEALTPGQRIRPVVAIGTAEGQSWDTAQVAGPDPADPAAPDTVGGLALGERDLIFADTITGFFKDDSLGAARPDSTPPAPADSAPGPRRRVTPRRRSWSGCWRPATRGRCTG